MLILQNIFLLIVTSIILLLLSNALTMRKDKSILYSRVSIILLVFTLIILLNNFFINSLSKGIAVYGGLFNVTTFTCSFNIFIFAVSTVILSLTAFFPRKVFTKEYYSLKDIIFNKLTYNKNIISNKKGEQFRIIEYSLIILFVLCGAGFLISAGDLISIFLSIELQSYGLYIISTLYRDSESSTGSGLTYFLLGGLSSCFILLGSGLLYASTGTTSLDNIYLVTDLVYTQPLFFTLQWYDPYYLYLSLIIISVGFLFKVSAAPFHFWSPDVYDGIPTIVTTYVAIIAKISIFAFLLELIYFTGCEIIKFNWTDVLLISSLLSLIIGSVLGLTQFRIKRLFAYSTISHVGFILLALSINVAESTQSYIFYLLQYSIVNLNAFFILLALGFSLYFYVSKDKEENAKLIDQNNSPVQLISQMKGYFYINPFIAISLTITLFSFVGIPPVIGFFAKQMILSAALDNGYIFMSIVAILTSVIGAFYYLNIIKTMFFDKHNYTFVSTPILNENLGFSKEDYDQETSASGYIYPYHNIFGFSIKSDTQSRKFTIYTRDVTINSCIATVISILSLLLILFIFIPTQWFNIVNILTLILFNS